MVKISSKVCNLNHQMVLRKSKWILIADLALLIIISLTLIFLLYLFHFVGDYLKDFPIIRFISACVFLLGVMFYFMLAISWVVGYYYDTIIIGERKIYRFRIGLFFRDSLDVIELYRVQEIETDMNDFLKIWFNVGHLILVEPNDMKKVFHRVDDPKKVVLHLGHIKDKLIEERMPHKNGNGKGKQQQQVENITNNIDL